MAVVEEESTSLDIIASWEGGYRCRIPVRDFELVSDEPVKVGGTDTGPMPTELFLASLAACFTLAIGHVARKRGVELPDLSVRVQGQYQGLRFGRIRVEVYSDYPREELQQLVERAQSYCYVSNTLRNEPELEFVAAERPFSQDLPPPRD